MERDVIEAALGDLGDELGRRGIRARLWAVGGVVMVMAFGSRTSTADVDVAAQPSGAVFDAALDVARRRGLPERWLNDDAAAWLPPGGQESWMPVRHYGELEVFLADERMMLALKLRASRGQRDQHDIRVLLQACGVTTEAAALAIYDEFFPEDPLPRVHRAALAEIIAGLAPAGVPAGSAPPDRRARAARAARAAEGDLVWVHSPRGSVSHRIGRQDGHEMLTACGQRLPVAGLRGSRSPGKRPCERCTARRAPPGP
ncbi:MAG: hypothetical protein ACRDZR_13340 [Acidimicrobiales bacterium]